MKRVNKAYQAAWVGAAFYLTQSPGYLKISGATRREYLQRQTTNDLGLLSLARALPSLLTSSAGRVLEVFTLLDQGEELGLVTQPGHGPGLAAYFRKHRFFNDQMEITDQGPEWTQIEIHGPQGAEALARLGFSGAPGLDEVMHTSWQGQPVIALGEEGFTTALKFRVLAPAAIGEQISKEFADLEQLDLSTQRVLRVEAKLAGDPEFNGEYTPFEIGLGRLVSAEKGCYTGQEVLARQVTYDKIVRSLAQLRAAELVEPGDVVLSAGKEIGNVTSAAVSPRFGAIALAVLRRPHDEPGTKLEILGKDGGVPASVS